MRKTVKNAINICYWKKMKRRVSASGGLELHPPDPLPGLKL